MMNSSVINRIMVVIARIIMVIVVNQKIMVAACQQTL